MTAQVAPAPATADEVPWSRTSPRTVLVYIVRESKAFIPALILMLGFGSQSSASNVVSLGFGALLTLLTMAVLAAHWWGRRYRVTDQAVEQRVTLFGYERRATAIPRARVRSVTTSAHLLHRLVGVVVVTVSSAGTTAIVLEAMSRPDAERLALSLTGKAPGSDAPADDPASDGTAELVRLDLRWLRYAPMGVTGFATLAALAWLLLRWFGEPLANLYFPEADGNPPTVVPDLPHLPAVPAPWGLPWWAVAVVTATALLLAATIAAVVAYLLAHWGFLLVRTADGSLTSRYGLVSRGGATIRLDQVSAVMVTERPLQRLARAATANVYTYGRGRMLLIPPAPARRAHEVCATVLGEHGPDVDPDRGPTRHPLRPRSGAALQRRLVRVLLPALIVVALACTPLPWWSPEPLGIFLVAALVLPAAVAVAVGRHRSMGEALTRRYLITRCGHLRKRQTIAADRSAILGWHITATPMQRRAGLLTVNACISVGHCPMPDIDAHHGLALAAEANPGLLGQFLRPESSLASTEQVTSDASTFSDVADKSDPATR